MEKDITIGFSREYISREFMRNSGKVDRTVLETSCIVTVGRESMYSAIQLYHSDNNNKELARKILLAKLLKEHRVDKSLRVKIWRAYKDKYKKSLVKV